MDGPSAHHGLGQEDVLQSDCSLLDVEMLKVMSE